MKNLPLKPNDAQVAAYLWGALSADEALEIERYAATNPDFAADLEEMRSKQTQNASQGSTVPPPRAKRRLFEAPELQDEPVGRDFPPFIHSQVQVADFMPWIAEALAKLTLDTEDFAWTPVAASPDTHTLLVKMCTSIPQEVHHNEIERVLLVQGKCDFVVGEVVHSFGPGDRYQLPLHVPHAAYNTASEPCIFIVQRTKI